MTTPNGPFQALICDFDMTLVDSKLDIANALAWCFTQTTGQSIDSERILPLIGQGLQAMFNTFSPGIKVGSPEFFDNLKMFQARYKETCTIHTRVYPGVAQTLSRLKEKKIRLAVASNKHGHIARHVATGLGIVDLFEHFQGTEALRGKPDPGVLLAACEALKVDPASTVSVGDRASDIVAAKAAGCLPVAVTYGVDDRPALEAERPARLFDRFDRLLELF